MNTYTFRFWQGGQWNLMRIQAQSLTEAERKMRGMTAPWELVSWGYE